MSVAVENARKRSPRSTYRCPRRILSPEVYIIHKYVVPAESVRYPGKLRAGRYRLVPVGNGKTRPLRGENGDTRGCADKCRTQYK